MSHHDDYDDGRGGARALALAIIWASALAVIVALLGCHAARAWAPISPAYRCPQPCRWSYNPAGEPLGAENVVRSAADAWNDTGASFHFEYMGRTDAPLSMLPGGSGGDGQMVVGWGQVDGNNLAVTHLLLDGTGWDCDVVLAPDYWDWTPERVFGVVIHEFGHCAGLSHSDVPGAVMNPLSCCIRSGLADDDRAGLLALYPWVRPVMGYANYAARAAR